MKITKYKKDTQTLYKVQAYIGTYDNGVKCEISRAGFKTQKECKDLVNKLKYEFKSNKNNKKKKTITFSKIYQQWLKNYSLTVKETTLAKTKQIFNNHILVVFKDKDINKITSFDCQGFINSLTSYATGKKIYDYAKSVMEYAFKLSLIKENPFDKVIIPQFKKYKKHINYLDKEEVKKLMEVIDDEMWYAYFRLLIYAGLRKSEALALHWSDIDFKKSTITINHTIGFGDNSKLIRQAPKTESSQDEILLDAETLQILRNLKKTTSSIIVFNNNGKYIYPSRVGEALTKYTTLANIKRIRVHDLRHTHASLLISSGASIKAVQQRLRHADIKTTMNIYAHLTKDAEKDSLDNFVNYIG